MTTNTESTEPKNLVIAREKAESLLQSLGLTFEQQSGFMKVAGPKGRAMYIGAGRKAKSFARVDLSGFTHDTGTRSPHCGVFGNVKQQLDMREPITEEEALRNLSALLEHMKSLPEVVKEKKAPKAKAPKNADGEAAATGNVPESADAKAARAARLDLIKKVAAEKGVGVSQKTEAEAAEVAATTETPAAQA